MMHIVDFDNYCLYCKHKDLKEWKDPWNLCLASTMNEESRKPVYFEEGESTNRETRKS